MFQHSAAQILLEKLVSQRSPAQTRNKEHIKHNHDKKIGFNRRTTEVSQGE